jgi:hypothetical protein
VIILRKDAGNGKAFDFKKILFSPLRMALSFFVTIQAVLFFTLYLPPALAGGIKCEWFVLALAKIVYFLAKANSKMTPYSSS